MPAEAFARDVLREGLHAIEVHEGDSFRFGYQAQAGIAELIDHMENGVLAPEKNVESLTRAMEMLLDNPGLRERLGANARQKVMANFSLDRSTAKLRWLFAGPTSWAGIRTTAPPDSTESRSAAQGTTETQSRNAAHRFPALSEEAKR